MILVWLLEANYTLNILVYLYWRRIILGTFHFFFTGGWVAQKSLCRKREIGNSSGTVWKLIWSNVYLFLRSEIATKLKFQKSLLKNNEFGVMSVLSQLSEITVSAVASCKTKFMTKWHLSVIERRYKYFRFSSQNSYMLHIQWTCSINH